MDLEKVRNFLQKNNQPKFRLDQIKKAVFQDGVSAWSEATTLSKELRETMEKEIKILSFSVEKILVSKNKQSIKALLNLQDGEVIETVLLSSEKNWTVCISSQAGCPLNCAFCATGREGFKRNLTSEEITDQVLFWKQYLSKRQEARDKRQENRNIKKNNHITCLMSHVSSVVYMGMGEPFLNWDQVKKSLDNLINPELFGFGSRSISVSTAGIPEGIEIFTETFPQINLAISLHFADDETRSRYMPISRQYNLEKIRETLKKYFQKSKRKVFIEYILFRGLNDSLQDARKLSEYLKSVGHSYLLHVNLIGYNAEYEKNDKFRASLKEAVLKFKDCLETNHIQVTIRKSLGSDIQGACGQLAGKS